MSFTPFSLPQNETECDSIDVVEECMQEYTSSTLQDELLALYFSISLEDDLDQVDLHEVQALLAEPLMPNQPSWTHKVDTLPNLALEPPKNSLEKPSTLELKVLSDHLKYVFLGSDDTIPVIISSMLTPDQESKLRSMLKDHKSAIGWSIADLRVNIPLVYMHRIHMESNLVLIWDPGGTPRRATDRVIGFDRAGV